MGSLPLLTGSSSCTSIALVLPSGCCKTAPRQLRTLQPGPWQRRARGRKTGPSSSGIPGRGNRLAPGGADFVPGLILLQGSFVPLSRSQPAPSLQGRGQGGAGALPAPLPDSWQPGFPGGALPSLIASKLPAKGGFGRGTRCICLAGKVGNRGNRVFEK